MTDKCPRCGKSVYFAERRMYKGQYYHQLCSNKQQDDDLAGKKLFALHEEMNCNPQDRPVNAAQSAGATRTVPPRHRTCTSCSFQLNEDCKFCPNCGAKAEDAKAPEPEKQKPDPRVFCSSCAQRYADDGRFCTGCGNKRPE